MNAVTTKPELNNVTKFEKISAFEKLSQAAVNALNAFINTRMSKDADVKANELAAEVKFLRETYTLIFHFPTLQDAYKDNIFTEMKLNLNEITNKVCEKLRMYDFKIGTDAVQADINHIGKIMNRYKLDFHDAFNFWALSSQLKTDLKYTGSNGKRLGDAIEKINMEKILETGKKIGLSADDISQIKPELLVKMNRSCSKSIAHKQQAGLFASNADYNNALETIGTNNSIRLGLKK